MAELSDDDLGNFEMDLSRQGLLGIVPTTPAAAADHCRGASEASNRSRPAGSQLRAARPIASDSRAAGASDRAARAGATGGRQSESRADHGAARAPSRRRLRHGKATRSSGRDARRSRRGVLGKPPAQRGNCSRAAAKPSQRTRGRAGESASWARARAAAAREGCRGAPIPPPARLSPLCVRRPVRGILSSLHATGRTQAH